MPTWTRPRARAAGFAARDPDSAQTTAWSSLIDTFVIQVNLEDLFPTGTAMDPTTRAKIDGYLQWAASNKGVNGRSVTAHLRIYGGFWVPQWVRNAVTMLTWYTNSGLPTIPADRLGGPSVSDSSSAQYLPGTPKWWTSTLWDIYADLLSRIIARWGSHPALASIELPNAMTQFAEPCNHQGFAQENVDAQMNGGWSVAAENQAFIRSWTDARSICAPYGLAVRTAWNPFGTYSGSAGAWRFQPSNDLARTTALMDQQVATLGRMADVGNNSFDASWQDTGARSTEQQMWDYHATLASRGVAVSLQTSTLSKMNGAGYTVQQTVDALTALGAYRIELPVGSQTTGNGAGNYVGGSYAAPKSAAIAAKAPDGPQVYAAVNGDTGAAAATQLLVALPAGIPDGAHLYLGVTTSSAATLASSNPITRQADASVVPFTTISANDKNATNFTSNLLDITLAASDSSQTLVVALSASSNAEAIGAIVTAGTAPASVFTAIAADQGTLAGAPDRGGITLIYAWARTSNGTTTITLPSSVATTVQTSTSTSTINVAGAAGQSTGTGGGTVSTSPSASKVSGYTLTLAPIAAPLMTGTVMTASSPTSTSSAAALTTGTTLGAAGTVVTSTSAALTTGSTLSAASSVQQPATAALSTGTALTATATRQQPATAALSTGTTLSAATSGSSSAAAAMTTGTVLAAAGQASSSAASALTTGTVLAAAGQASSSAAAAMTTGTTLTAAGQGFAVAASALTTGTALVAAAVRVTPAGVTMTVATVLATDATVGRAASLSLTFLTEIRVDGSASVAAAALTVGFALAAAAGLSPTQTRGRLLLTTAQAELVLLAPINGG